MVFLLWLVEGFPAITNHSRNVRHTHTHACLQMLILSSHAHRQTLRHSHTHTHMPVEPHVTYMQHRCNNTHACCMFGHTGDDPADLARRWETTFIASKSRGGARQGAPHPRETHSTPGIRPQMLHEAKLEEKPADLNTPGLITSMPQFRPTQTPPLTLAKTTHTSTP